MPLIHMVMVEGEVKNMIDSFACAKCGHMEFYTDPKKIPQIVEADKAERKEFQREIYDGELKSLKDVYLILQTIVNDEKQSPEAVEKAKADMVRVGNEIGILEEKLEALEKQ